LSRRRNRVHRLPVLGGVILVAAAALLIAVFGFGWLRGSPGQHASVGSSGSAIPRINLVLPNDWARVSASSVTGAPKAALAVIQRRDKTALLVILRTTSVPSFGRAFSTTLNRQLAGRYADYKFISAKVITIRPGKVFVFSYLRAKQGLLHTITIVPAGSQGYVVTTASPPSARKAAAEIGTMLHSITLGPA
jgi:hypothetical protein